MKKTRLSLKLHRETLRHLEPGELAPAAGAIGTQSPTACDGASGCIPSCVQTIGACSNACTKVGC